MHTIDITLMVRIMLALEFDLTSRLIRSKMYSERYWCSFPDFQHELDNVRLIVYLLESCFKLKFA